MVVRDVQFSKMIQIALVFIYSVQIIFAQDCSPQQLHEKYERYKQRLLRSFVVVDRDSSGCINDGIGQLENNPCVFQKEGYSIPATGITINWSGADAMGIRNEPGQVDFYDPECARFTHWDQSKGVRFNYAGFSSESPTQLGWYIMMLCTDYEIARVKVDSHRMKLSLEELFLALQAVRRLDMQAQCMFERFYTSQSSLPTSSFCTSKYCDKNHPKLCRHYLHSSCDFKAQLDGYYGFFIREDATQSLQEKLHDPSEEQFHVDAISSVHSNNSFPCVRDTLNEICWFYYNQGFMSQDQVIGLLNGLIFVKRFIPSEAYVTTCDGKRFWVLDIAQKYTDALVGRIDRQKRNYISLPGSANCVSKRKLSTTKTNEIELSNFEGGQASPTILGFQKVANYILGQKKYHINFWEKTAWTGLKLSTRSVRPRSGNFYLQLEALTNPELDAIDVSNMLSYHKEIYLLQNYVLYGRIKLSDDFLLNIEAMLCRAPYECQCIKGKSYVRDTVHVWPKFECNNTPGWLGGRWDGGIKEINFHEEKKDNWPYHSIVNGLDYMNLYNLHWLIKSEP
ncbi:MAG: hypothetical protein M3Q56_06895 [Bacteroidota bacterium]|nr:hypothetical protein [Bacteroidota bacterium]